VKGSGAFNVSRMTYDFHATPKFLLLGNPSQDLIHLAVNRAALVVADLCPDDDATHRER